MLLNALGFGLLADLAVRDEHLLKLVERAPTTNVLPVFPHSHASIQISLSLSCAGLRVVPGPRHAMAPAATTATTTTMICGNRPDAAIGWFESMKIAGEWLFKKIILTRSKPDLPAADD